MTELRVLTTMVPRNDLHQQCVYPLLKAVSRRFDITWHVHIDHTDHFSESESNETRQAIQKFCEEHEIRSVVWERWTDCGFSSAAKTLFNSVNASDDAIFLWLEDDWEVTDTSGIADELSEFAESDERYYSLGAPYSVLGPPFFFKKDLFDEIRWLYVNEPLIDPELTFSRAALRVWWNWGQIMWRFPNENDLIQIRGMIQKHVKNEIEEIKPVSRIREPVVVCRGKQWRKDRGIGRSWIDLHGVWDEA